MEERALLGTTANGSVVILATDGATMAYDCREIGHDADEVGIAYETVRGRVEPGLYLFTGAFYPSGDYDGGGDWRGVTRPVAAGEVAELYAMMPPPVPDDDREEIQPGDSHYYRPQ